MVSRAAPTARAARAELPTDSKPFVICNGRMLAFTIALWRRSWKVGSSKRAKSARHDGVNHLLHGRAGDHL